MSLLGIDVGRKMCRAVAVSVDGEHLASAGQSYADTDLESEPGRILTEALWEALRDTISQISEQTESQDPIQALSISSIGDAVAFLTAEGTISTHVMIDGSPWPADYGARLEASIGRERLFDITGCIPNDHHVLATLCGLRDHEQQNFRRTWRFVPPMSLASYLLGGAPACDYSLACDTLLFNTRRREWSGEILKECGLLRDKLPDLAPAGTRIGTISVKAARETGLPVRTQIILGGHDLACTALGSGVSQSGLACYNLGRSIHLMPVFHAIPLVSLMLQHGLNIQHHVVPDLLLSTLYNPWGGRVLTWFIEALAAQEKRWAQKRGLNVYSLLLKEMPEEPTPLMVLPQMADPHLGDNPEDLQAALLGLNLETTRGEIIRALLEGMTYYFAAGKDTLEQTGMRVERCRATGGGARSAAWLQLSADILGVPVQRTRFVHPAALGAAMVAGVGTEVYSDYDEATRIQVRTDHDFQPSEARYARYQQKIARYKELLPLFATQL